MVTLVRKAPKGISLPEVVIVSAIIGIIGLITPKLMRQANDFFLMNRARLDIQREARIVTGTVSRHLRQALANTVVIDQIAGQPAYSRITFTTQAAPRKPSQTIVIWQRSHTAGCPFPTASSGELVMTINGLPLRPRVLSENIRFVAFSIPRSDLATVASFALSMEKAAASGRNKALHVTSEKIGIMNTGIN